MDAGGDAKRPAGESDEQRALKQLRTDTQPMFAGDGNMFFVSQPMQTPLQMAPQSMLGLMGGIPTSQAQQMQQQYAAMAARRNAQQAMAMMQNVPTSMPQGVPSMQMQGVPMQANAPNIHVASILAGQGMQTNGVAMTQSQPVSAATGESTGQQGGATVTPQEVAVPFTDEPCLLCGKKEGVFSCNGGCGLHAHPACIGEDAIFPFVVGRLCGSCFIMQQNRVSPEDLTKGGANALSVRRAILSANLLTNDKRHFDHIGHLASLRLGEIGSVAGYPIKPFAEKFIEPYLQRWIREKLLNVDKWMLNVREIFTVILGLYSLKRACIAHDMREKVVKIMEARKFTVTDYFGWHPAIEGPNVRCSHLCGVCGIRNPPELEMCSRCHHKLAFPSVFSKYSGSLLAAYYSEQLGIQLGATTLDVFSHTNSVRGMYKGLQPMDTDGLLWDQFVDQLRGIFALLDVMSDFGTLQLNPDLFVPETNILFNPAYLNHAMLNNEFEVVGKFLQFMKLFGPAKSAEHQNTITTVENFLLFKQLPEGGWCKLGRGKVDEYKATVICAKALLTPEFRGCGPISHECQRLLEKWARGSNPKLPSAASAVAKANDNSKLKLLASGATVKPNTQGNLKRLEAMYKRQTGVGGSTPTLDSLMAERMKQLLKQKHLEGKQTDVASKESVKKETGPTKSEGVKEESLEEAASMKKELVIKKEENVAGGTTDSEDAKQENQTTEQSDKRSATAIRTADTHEDDDYTLTNMSLHEDLEIFDGLQFDEGGIIDLNFPSLGGHGEGDIDVGDDADGTDAPGQDEEEDDAMGDNVYDDDQDENDDTSGHAADQEPAEDTAPPFADTDATPGT